MYGVGGRRDDEHKGKRDTYPVHQRLHWTGELEPEVEEFVPLGHERAEHAGAIEG